MVASIRRNQLAALGLVRVLPVVKPLFQGLCDGFALADFVLLVVGRGRRQPSFRYDKRRLWSAAVVLPLEQIVRIRIRLSKSIVIESYTQKCYNSLYKGRNEVFSWVL